MISIHRNCETKALEIMITTCTNTSYVKYDDSNSMTHLHQLIGSAAQTMGLSWDDAVDEFGELYSKLYKLSKERKRRLSKIDIKRTNNDGFEFIYFLVRANGIITLHEIHWLDWYMRKHKLLESL